MNKRRKAAVKAADMRTVQVDDLVGENTSPWIKAKVVAVEESVSKATGRAMWTVTVEWLKDGREGNLIVRKGQTRRYAVNSYGVSSIRKVR